MDRPFCKKHNPNTPIIYLLSVSVFIFMSCAGCGQQPEALIPTPSLFQVLTLTPSPSYTSTPQKLISTLIPFYTPTPTITLTPIQPTPSIYFPLVKPGQYFLYWSASELGLISIDGQEKSDILLPASWTAGDTYLRLSPDRKKLVLFRGLVGGNMERTTLIVVDLEKGTSSVLVKADSCYRVTWAPDNERLAATCDDGFYVFTLKDQNTTILPVSCGGFCEDVKWSPDGKWIAFQMSRLARFGQQGIFLLNTACLSVPDSCLANLENISASSFPYDWAPNGHDLAIMNYKKFDKNEEIGLDFFEVPTRRVARKIEILNLTGYDIMIQPSLAWSPEGKWIAVTQSDGIYKIPVQGGAPIRVASLSWPMVFQWIYIPHPFAPGAKYTITTAGNGLNLRDQPSRSGKPLKMLKAGDEITIVKGPTLADGYTWWQMRTQDGVEGWAEDLPDWYQ